MSVANANHQLGNYSAIRGLVARIMLGTVLGFIVLGWKVDLALQLVRS